MDQQPKVTAIIPMKPLASAKLRLSGSVSRERRAAICLMMLDRVLASTCRSAAVGRTWVVGGDHWVGSASEHHGALWLSELGCDLNDTLWRAFQRCFRAGADAALFLPADLPLLAPTDVDGLVGASKGLQAIVLAPAGRDGGTNALLVPEGIAFRPRLGEDSFQRHLQEAKSRACSVVVYQSRGVELDLDTAVELRTCEESVPGFGEELARWEQFWARACGQEELTHARGPSTWGKEWLR